MLEMLEAAPRGSQYLYGRHEVARPEERAQVCRLIIHHESRRRDPWEKGAMKAAMSEKFSALLRACYSRGAGRCTKFCRACRQGIESPPLTFCLFELIGEGMQAPANIA